MTVGASESLPFYLSFETIPSRNGQVEAIEIVDFRVSIAPSGESAKRNETSRRDVEKSVFSPYGFNFGARTCRLHPNL